MVYVLLLSGCGIQTQVREANTKFHMNQILSGFEIYRKEFGNYPDPDPKSVFQGLWKGNPKKLAIMAPTEKEERAERFLDSWGTPYVYSLSANGISIRSAGADRKFGSQDDIKAEQPKHESDSPPIIAGITLSIKTLYLKFCTMQAFRQP